MSPRSRRRSGARTSRDLLTVTCQRILDAQSTVVTGDIGQRNLPSGRSWGAVLDDSVLPDAPQQAVGGGAVDAQVPAFGAEA
ncbi:hypothetical protein [Streptomyces canus]|uniref:hypothetical protein n=1 Tax=Streptomyces canus TaxID=58343 RepID=UPI0038697378